MARRCTDKGGKRGREGGREEALSESRVSPISSPPTPSRRPSFSDKASRRHWLESIAGRNMPRKWHPHEISSRHTFTTHAAVGSLRRHTTIVPRSAFVNGLFSESGREYSCGRDCCRPLWISVNDFHKDISHFFFIASSRRFILFDTGVWCATKFPACLRAAYFFPYSSTKRTELSRGEKSLTFCYVTISTRTRRRRTITEERKRNNIEGKKKNAETSLHGEYFCTPVSFLPRCTRFALWTLWNSRYEYLYRSSEYPGGIPQDEGPVVNPVGWLAPGSFYKRFLRFGGITTARG